MSIVVNEDSRIVVQGITGNAGRFHTTLMLRYGTNVVAGTTPGKGGEQVEGVQVYNTVSEAVTNHDANTSIVFVPAHFAKTPLLKPLMLA